MTDHQWQEVERLFDELRSLTETQRENELTRQCEDEEVRSTVLQLLQHHDCSTGFLSDNPRQELETPRLAPFPSQAPVRIGNYQLIRPIAAGGMGIVYEAQQSSPHRRVAIKLLRISVASESSSRRFLHEVDILGRLQHPGIAKIHDAGVHEDETGLSLPYFAMEFVPEAKDILRFSVERKLATQELCQLMVQVCEAVHHAHLRGVIHRDLKPANILVDENGQPRVIDFGVARIAETETAFSSMGTSHGELIGTLRYMSPEQCDPGAHDLDLRTDVYSLGVTFYELLTGELPYSLPTSSVIKAAMVIRENLPVPPSRRCPEITGDWETVLQTALAKDPEDRYQSVMALAEDIRRVQTHRPILARPPGLWTEIRLWTRRRRALAVSLAIVVAAILAGAGLATFGFLDARRSEQAARRSEDAEKNQRLIAQQQRDESEAVTRFLEDILHAASPLESKHEVTARELLDASLPRLASSFVNRPDVEARLRHTLGRAYIALGSYSEARKQIEASLRLREEHPNNDPAALSRTRVSLVFVRNLLGEYAEAEAYASQVIAESRESSTRSREIHAELLMHRGTALRGLGKFHQAVKAFEECLTGLDSADVDATEIRIHCLQSMGASLADSGDPDAAESPLREALEEAELFFDEGHPEVAQLLGDLGEILRRKNDLDGAQSLIEEAIQIYEASLGADHPSLYGALNNLGMIHGERRRFDEALACYQRVLRLLRAQDARHPELAATMKNLAELHFARREFRKADALYEQALAMSRSRYPSGHYETGIILQSFASSQDYQGNPEGAIEMLTEAIPILESTLGPDDHRTRGTLEYGAQILERMGRRHEAEDWRSRARTFE